MLVHTRVERTSLISLRSLLQDTTKALLLLLQDVELEAVELREGDQGLASFTDHKHVVNARGEPAATEKIFTEPGCLVLAAVFSSLSALSIQRNNL